MNILVNAAHAIEKRGVITIHTTTDRDGVLIVFEDDGKGMDEQTQARIFDPFYTTKPVGEGTGLGMSLSYNIIQKHGGTITVESQIGKGTRFLIWLPVKQSESKAVD
ncbi:sensor histidine kinase [Candidatus Reidiella endopervernicosa]|uniref:sensor histidine kinase n=1 Tax=Candidatus Reidiella endopervernicosa TaxID=2738883 RepID=UPI001F3EB867|nr:ATP-binding protein [Candidatus Reidiella endopervernicosa]